MTLRLSHAELQTAVQTGSLIRGGTPDRIEDDLYYLRIKLAFLHSPHREIYTFIDDEALMKGWTLSPSEAVFVLSKERFRVQAERQLILSPGPAVLDTGLTLLGDLVLDSYFEGSILLGLNNESRNPERIYADMKYASAHFERI